MFTAGRLVFLFHCLDKQENKQSSVSAFLTLVDLLQAIQHALRLFRAGGWRRLVTLDCLVLGLSGRGADGFLLAPQLSARVEVPEAVLEDILQLLPTSGRPLGQICTRAKRESGFVRLPESTST